MRNIINELYENPTRRNMRKLGNLIAYTCAFICISVWLVSALIIKLYDNGTEFILDSEKKFIIYENNVTTDRCMYYEVDFDKNKIIKREDTEKVKRKKINKVNKENHYRIMQIITQVTSDEKNKIDIQESERENYYRQNIFRFYSIKDYKGNLYYMKDVKYMKELADLL